MNTKSYKEQVVDIAIQGMIEGGYPAEAAHMWKFLLERIYECGYNDCRRDMFSVTQQELYNTMVLTTMPPQSSAAFNILQKISEG